MKTRNKINLPGNLFGILGSQVSQTEMYNDVCNTFKKKKN